MMIQLNLYSKLSKMLLVLCLLRSTRLLRRDDLEICLACSRTSQRSSTLPRLSSPSGRPSPTLRGWPPCRWPASAGSAGHTPKQTTHLTLPSISCPHKSNAFACSKLPWVFAVVTTMGVPRAMGRLSAACLSRCVCVCSLCGKVGAATTHGSQTSERALHSLLIRAEAAQQGEVVLITWLRCLIVFLDHIDVELGKPLGFLGITDVRVGRALCVHVEFVHELLVVEGLQELLRRQPALRRAVAAPFLLVLAHEDRDPTPLALRCEPEVEQGSNAPGVAQM